MSRRDVFPLRSRRNRRHVRRSFALIRDRFTKVIDAVRGFVLEMVSPHRDQGPDVGPDGGFRRDPRAFPTALSSGKHSKR